MSQFGTAELKTGNRLADSGLNDLEEEIAEIQFQLLSDVPSRKISTNYIHIEKSQTIRTVHIAAENNTEVDYYFLHGFGGTSLMYFPILNQVLAKGNAVLCELRGMGLMSKQQYRQMGSPEEVEAFYLEGIRKILDFYQSPKKVVIAHSFGAYLASIFFIKHPQPNTKIILLSPIGFTPAEQDYKNKISSCADVGHQVLSWLGWSFKLTYKSLLRRLWCQARGLFLRRLFSKFELTARQLEKMVALFGLLNQIPGGSDKLFYQLFQPRVLPATGHSIQQLLAINQLSCDTVCIYGGEGDWVDKQAAVEIAKMEPKLRVKIITNSTHMLPLHVIALRQVLACEL